MNLISCYIHGLVACPFFGLFLPFFFVVLYAHHCSCTLVLMLSRKEYMWLMNINNLQTGLY